MEEEWKEKRDGWKRNKEGKRIKNTKKKRERKKDRERKIYELVTEEKLENENK